MKALRALSVKHLSFSTLKQRRLVWKRVKTHISPLIVEALGDIHAPTVLAKYIQSQILFTGLGVVCGVGSGALVLSYIGHSAVTMVVSMGYVIVVTVILSCVGCLRGVLHATEYALVDCRLLANMMSSLLTLDNKVDISEFKQLLVRIKPCVPIIIRFSLHILMKYFTPELVELFNRVNATTLDKVDTADFFPLCAATILKPVFAKSRETQIKLALYILAVMYIVGFLILAFFGNITF